jgi:hypothetical protein
MIYHTGMLCVPLFRSCVVCCAACRPDGPTAYGSLPTTGASGLLLLRSRAGGTGALLRAPLMRWDSDAAYAEVYVNRVYARVYAQSTLRHPGVILVYLGLSWFILVYLAPQIPRRCWVEPRGASRADRGHR